MYLVHFILELFSTLAKKKKIATAFLMIFNMECLTSYYGFGSPMNVPTLLNQRMRSRCSFT